MVIVDTTVWIDYFRGESHAEAKWLDREISWQRLGLTDLILCEILQGVHGEGAVRQVQRELGRFEIFETGGTELAIAAAKNFRLLRQRGCTVRKTMDCLIATFCLRRGHALLHRDRDYYQIEKHLGLAVVHA